MGFCVLKDARAATDRPGWVFKVENLRPNAVLSGMKLIRANCITAAARYYLLYNALVTASRRGTVCLLAPAHLFDACDTLWSPTTLSCHSHVSIFFYCML